MRERDWQAIDRHTSKIARADHSSFLLAARVGEEGEISAAPVADKPEIALRSINMILFSGHSPGEGNKCSILLAAFSIPAHSAGRQTCAMSSADENAGERRELHQFA